MAQKVVGKSEGYADRADEQRGYRDPIRDAQMWHLLTPPETVARAGL